MVSTFGWSADSSQLWLYTHLKRREPPTAGSGPSAAASLPLTWPWPAEQRALGPVPSSLSRPATAKGRSTSVNRVVQHQAFKQRMSKSKVSAGLAAGRFKGSHLPVLVLW